MGEVLIKFIFYYNKQSLPLNSEDMNYLLLIGLVERVPFFFSFLFVLDSYFKFYKIAVIVLVMLTLFCDNEISPYVFK